MRYLQRMVGLLVLAIILLSVDLEALGEVLADCRIDLVIAGYGLNLVAIWVKSVRWGLILKALSITVGLGRTFGYYLAGIFLGVATPGRLGELGRYLYLKKEGIQRTPTAVASIVSDRLMDVCLLVVIGLLASVYFGLVDLAPELPWFGVTGLALALVLVYLFRTEWLGRSIRWLFCRYRSRELFRLFDSSVREFYLGLEVPFRKSFVSCLSLTVFAYLLFFASVWILARSLGIDIGLFEVSLTVGLASLLSLLPITFAGLGTRDAVFLWSFHRLGLEAAQALAFSAMVLAVTYLGNGLAGYGFYVALGRRVANGQDAG